MNRNDFSELGEQIKNLVQEMCIRDRNRCRIKYSCCSAGNDPGRSCSSDELSLIHI